MSGITDPSEEYFKDGLWGWDGSQWRKLGLLWGYYDAYHERCVNSSADAGLNHLYATVVPEGEIWIVTAAFASDVSSAISDVSLLVQGVSSPYVLVRKVNPVALEGAEFSGSVVVKAGERVRADFNGCTAGDGLYLYALGYKMKVT